MSLTPLEGTLVHRTFAPRIRCCFFLILEPQQRLGSNVVVESSHADIQTLKQAPVRAKQLSLGFNTTIMVCISRASVCIIYYSQNSCTNFRWQVM